MRVCAVVLFASASVAFAQTEAASPTFEVATIKPAAPQTRGMTMGFRGGPGTPNPGMLIGTNVTIGQMLMLAYGIKSFQISGQRVIESERYDITAKVPHGATREQFKIMVPNLLAERFKVVLHHESKDMPTYALVVAKGGPKLKEAVVNSDTAPPSPGGPPPGPPRGRGVSMSGNGSRFRIAGSQATVAQLADMLGSQLGRPVADETGLTKIYDIALEFAADPATMAGMAKMGVTVRENPPDGQSGPSIFSALQEQLGLKLEQKKAPVDVIVVDRVEKTPTEN